MNKPGEMVSCLGCRFKDNCPSTVEILSCIRLMGETIGVIAITSFTKEGHNRICSNLQTYQDAISELSFLIGQVVSNKTGNVESQNTERLVGGVMNISASPLLLCDSNGVITQYNAIASGALKFCKLSAASLWNILPEDMVKKILKGAEFHEADFIFTGFRARITNRMIKSDNKIIGIVIKLSNISYDEETKTESLRRIIGSTPETLHLHHMIKKLADSPTPVLITGETGTGKELVARSIHEHGKRSLYPFVAVNCAGIPESLFESELFGYEEGSFTGAKKGGKMGKLEMAQGGTLFLDELGDMPLSVQPKLLRVLQEYEVERVGSTEKIPLNIRIIAATNGNLTDMITDGKFREELYYRIAVINLEIPPLRQRKSDIIPIAKNYLNRLKQKIDTPALDFSPDVVGFLESYRWKGNIRELQNVVEYAANLCETTQIRLSDLPPKLVAEFSHPQSFPTQKQEDEDADAEKIKALIEEYGTTLEGKKRIAQVLGISLRTLYRKLDKIKA
ncbi:MAG: sigma 54-interacting transcriptional regulator [Oscillospiraceae bacterium]